MGIFTNNNHGSLMSSNNFEIIDVPANESYDNVTGCAYAVLENTMNDYALFEGMLASDFQEVAAIHEGYEVVNESAADIWNKIKEMFRKLLAKIKGVLKTFLAKLLGTFAESDKLYNKYLKTISGHSDWENFKIKGFREVKGASKDILTEIKKNNYDDKKIVYNASPSGSNILATLTNGKTEGKFKDIDKEDIVSAIIKGCLSGIDADKTTDIEKEFMDAMYNDSETKDDVDSSFLTGVQVGGLLNKNAGKKAKEAIENLNSKLTWSISKKVSELEKLSKALVDLKSKGKQIAKNDAYSVGSNAGDDQEDIKYSNDYGKVKNVSSNIPSESSSGDKEDVGDKHIQRASFYQRVASAEQEVITHYTSGKVKIIKFAISQARRVWASAAAYAMRKHEGVDYELYTAIGEDAAYDFVSEME